MPISQKTVQKIQALTSLISCPLCGKTDRKLESLSSCGHYLCAKCVDTYVISADNKCPKCYAINYRSDCKEDQTMTSLLKIANRIIKVIEIRQIEGKSVAKQEMKINKDNESQKQRVIDSLKLCIKSKESDKIESKTSSSSTTEVKIADNKPKPKSVTTSKPETMTTTSVKNKTVEALKKSFEYVSDDESIDSIPDSFDDTVVTNRKSFSKDNVDDDNTEVLSMVLKGLEASSSSPDDISNNFGTINEDQMKVKSSEKVKVYDSKSCQSEQEMSHKEIQTNKHVLRSVSTQYETPKKNVKSMATQYEVMNNVFKSVSTQSEVMQTEEQSVQTIEVVVNNNHTNNSHIVDNNDNRNCESNNCCFHEFINSCGCHSLKTFLKQLVEFSNNKSTDDKKGIIKVDNNNIQQTTSESTNLKTTTITEEVVSNVINAEQKENNGLNNKRTTRNRSKAVGITKKIDSKRSLSDTNDANSKKLKTNETVDIISTGESNEDTEQIKELEKDKEMNVEIEEVVSSTTSKKQQNRSSGRKQNKPKPTTKEVIDDNEVNIVDKEVTSDANDNNITKRVANKNRKTRKDTVICNINNNKIETNKESVSVSDNNNKDDINEDVFNFDNQNDGTNEESVKLKAKPSAKRNNRNKQLREETIATSEVKTKNSRKRILIDSDLSSLTNSKTIPIVLMDKLKVTKTTKTKSPDNDNTFKRPASPTPSEISVASSTSSRHRTSSSERSNKKFVIISSGLDDSQRKKIQTICHRLDAEVVDDWTDRVTHLVIIKASDRDVKDMICPRNAKYMKALLANKWIVTFNWIVDSDKFNRFVDESNYEISADRSATEQRVANKSRISGQKLFAKQMFLFKDLKETSFFEELKQFISIGGGTIVDSDDQFERNKRKTDANKLIVISEAIGLPNTQKSGIKYISKKTFMDSISNFTQI
ncbi:MATH and LRR domain-containing protein PFE0570w-like [Oppia nitens]|uniref:MATH and LRR domain-containing protein PFE0570w-like n=1 Tax=Oppia nitens TaxID=1686743 RepID=UPI0023DB138A|nr:MATH and LRR domain-containing protein PFE0570w-like [Oppia nitens]